MPEAITSQLSGGAGRIIDSYWPPRDYWRPNGVTPGQFMWTRNLGSATSMQPSASFSVNPNNGFNANVNGRSGATFGATVAAVGNGYGLLFSNWTMHFARRGIGVTNPPPNLRGLDPFGAMRIVMIASFANPAGPLGTAVDNGLEFCLAGIPVNDQGCILMLGTAGFGFRVYDTDKCEVIVRPVQAAAVTRIDVATAAQGYACSDWHAYEIRIIAAQGGQEAVAKFFIDGVLKLTLSWGPGNVMPETSLWSGTPTAGMRAQIVSTGGFTSGLTVDGVYYHVAKDELNLL